MSLPTGTISPFATPTPPSGWLLCNGQEVLISQYQPLYNIITDTYNGASVTSGYFKVPDLRGRFIRGTGSDGSNGMNGSSLGFLGEKQSHALRSHTHPTYTVHDYTTQSTRGGDYRWSWNQGSRITGSSTSCSDHDGRSSTETRPYCISLIFCIKT